MIYSYLFEVKSIQAYLFASGKLRDTIAASERLGMLIDNNESSTLYQVLQQAGLLSDLLDKERSEQEGMIRFLRCKGGAFYAFCKTEQPLLTLRSLWTLTVQQMFPSLAFTDALTSADTLQKSISQGHKALSADRNTPAMKFPVASAITRRNIKTGGSEVPLNPLSKGASVTGDMAVDIDNEMHRQAYQTLNMRDRAALQDRFTPQALKGKLAYPIDFENDFKYEYSAESVGDKDGKKDIALIHIDGNGLGKLLLALKERLEKKDDDEYRKGFRDFSDALSSATELAAQEATQWVYEVARYQHKVDKSSDTRTFLPVRPIVLGGDDVTLLCQSGLAIEYGKRFCQAFERHSRDAMASLFNRHLKGSKLSQFLTASGGVLFNKGAHPFMHSHHLAEELCSQAKQLTKSVHADDSVQVGPAALAFYRVSNASNRALSDLQKETQSVQLEEAVRNVDLKLAGNAFFVDMSTSGQADLTTLEQLVILLKHKDAPFNTAKLRQMVTCLGMGDKAEADRIYRRAVNRAKDTKSLREILELFQQFARLSGTDLGYRSEEFRDWYWLIDDGHYQSIIYDLITYDRFFESVTPLPSEDEICREASV